MDAPNTGHRLRTFLTTAALGAFGSDGLAFDFERHDYPTAVAPVFIAAADFDLDDHLDLAVAIFSGTDVALFKGNGQGAFSSAGSAPAGIGPWGMVASDVNGDTRPDMAVTNTESNDVTILLGNGALGFTSQPVVPVGRYPRAVCSARFNADAHVDLAVSNLLDNTVSILLGDGQGRFVTAPLLPGGGNGPGVGGAADFDRDGHQDLAVGNQNTHDVTIWLGHGDGTFAGPSNLPAVNHPHSAVVGYVDTDTFPDIVADNVNASPAVLSVFRGNGNGGFAAAANYATGDSAPAHLTIADFDRDGCPDLAAACRLQSGSVAVLNGDGTGAFLPPERFSVGARPNGVVAGDFDEDGRPDLATANFGGNSFTILLNRTPVTGVDPGPVPSARRGIVLGHAVPNPFDPLGGSARFPVEVSHPGAIAVRILSPAGRVVRVLDAWMGPGAHVWAWDGRDDAGQPMGAGVFTIEIRQGPDAAASKLVVLR